MQAVGVPSVWTTATRDVYVSLSSLESGRIGLNLYRYPYMWLLWLGGSVVMLGGFWALGVPRRTRQRERSPEQQRSPEVGAGV